MTHRYGNHDPSTAPTHVTVGAGSNAHEAPIPAAILNQRQRINEIAYSAGTTPVADIALARAARDRGQSIATAAHPEERIRVEQAIRQLAATGQPFSANDARVIHGIKGGVVGATFTALRKSGVIRPCGDEISTDVGTHGHRLYRWVGAA